MKYVSLSLIVISLGLIIAGIVVQLCTDNVVLMKQLYGFGSIILFLIWMPLFLILRSFKTKLLDFIPKPEEEEPEGDEIKKDAE